MTCSTRACPFPATHGKLCAVCLRMLLDTRFFQRGPDFSGPSERVMHARYNREAKRRQNLTRGEKSVVQSAL